MSHFFISKSEKSEYERTSVNNLKSLFFVFLLFPATSQAYDKLQLELIKPTENLKMKVGESFAIKFKALSNKSNLKYVAVLKHGDGKPWAGVEGPLALQPQKLIMGENTVHWDGQSVAQEKNGKEFLVKLPQNLKAAYYIQILILESDSEIKMVGPSANYHRATISKLKVPKFRFI